MTPGSRSGTSGAAPPGCGWRTASALPPEAVWQLADLHAKQVRRKEQLARADVEVVITQFVRP
ncbi:hypothetical protein ABZ553_30645 [Streptomyces sparsogenes]|uniref:hypothetical protein n=1 Tax=Streptomyces sparsogenes TaxID=67365 RepID=UPI0033E1063A